MKRQGLQITLAILKPDLCMRAVARKAVKKIIRDEGFFIVHRDVFKLSRSTAQLFYAEHEGKFFFDRLVDFMCIHPIECMVLAHHNAIQLWRDLMGPTKPYIARITAPHTIRGTFGLTDTRNSTHGSDSDESAEREIGILLSGFNTGNWYQNEEKHFQNGKVNYCKKEEVHKPV